jgi:WD40 repeat protein
VYIQSIPYSNKKAQIEFTLRAHDRAITDINFSAHHPDLLATCGMDSYVFVHDLRNQQDTFNASTPEPLVRLNAMALASNDPASATTLDPHLCGAWPNAACSWIAGAYHVKWNLKDDKIIASSHDKYHVCEFIQESSWMM